MNDQKTLLTTQELAQHLRCTERHIQNLMKDGLPHIRVSERMLRFDLDTVNAWLAQRTKETT